MKSLLVIATFLAFSPFSNAKVVGTAPQMVAPNIQSELMKELEEAPEDIDFDSEDELQVQSIDEENLVIDAEIEKIALDEKITPKVEAKATTKKIEVKK